jgi:hypothetical protein
MSKPISSQRDRKAAAVTSNMTPTLPDSRHQIDRRR